MLVDWHHRVGVHPVRNDLTPRERDLISAELLQDPDSRLRAAVAGTPFAMSTWAAVSTASALYSLLGAEWSIPGTDADRVAPVVTHDEREAARERLRTYSAIADLPEG